MTCRFVFFLTFILPFFCLEGYQDSGLDKGCYSSDYVCRCDRGDDCICGRDCQCEACTNHNVTNTEPIRYDMNGNPIIDATDWDEESSQTSCRAGKPCYYSCKQTQFCCGCCRKYPEEWHERWWNSAHAVWWSPYEQLCGDCAFAFSHCGLWCVWLPDEGPLFKPFIADPRQVTSSAGWRWNDNAIGKNIIPVSYGTNIAFVRCCNVWPWGGMLQINLEGGLWAVFAPLRDSAPLINADYYVGFPIEYAIDRWAFRLRVFHISSHLGDEFLIDNPGYDRKNPSAEYLDFYVSNYLTDCIRLYGGLGWVIQHDCSFNQGRFYAEVGTEIRLYGMGFWDPCQHFYGEPFFAMDFRYFDMFKRHIDSTYALGYEWGKTDGCHRRLRLFMEYHDGNSVDGQFMDQPSNYFSIRVTYGY